MRTQITLPVFLVIAMAAMTMTRFANAQTLVHVDISSAFNADVILNTGDGPSGSGIDNGGAAYLTNSRAQAFDAVNGNGLPDNGFFPSSSSLNVPIDVQLAYRDTDNGNNAIRFGSNGQTASVSLAAGEQGKYSSLYFFATGGNANGTVDVEFTYSDSTTSSQTGLIVQDWFNDTFDNIINDLDRTNSTQTALDNSNDPAIFAIAHS